MHVVGLDQHSCDDLGAEAAVERFFYSSSACAYAAEK
jgi:hypothetical protein